MRMSGKPLTGPLKLFPLALQGKKVLIKPNVLRAATAAEGITTHPAVLRAVVDKVETLGPAAIVVGDNPGLFDYGANEASFQKTGLMEAAKGYYQNIGNDSRQVAFHPDFMETVSLSRIVLDADIIISLPKFKTHGLTVITGAIKNSYGFLPGAQKARLHKAAGSPERFHELVVEVFRLRVPDLFLVDAIVGMEGNGPASPDLRDIGLILASDNAVALDGVMAVMMGCEPGRLRFLQKAKELGLGDYDLSSLEVVGDVAAPGQFQAAAVGRGSHYAERDHPGADPRADAPAAAGRSGALHRLRQLHRAVSGVGPVHGRLPPPGGRRHLHHLLLLPGNLCRKGHHPEISGSPPGGSRLD